MNRLTLLLAISLSAPLFSLSAQNTPPVVASQVADFTEYAGAPAHSIDLSGTFTDPDMTDAIRFATSLGNIDIGLYSQKSVTVANFLSYVDQGRYFIQDPVTHGTASSFFHRAVPGFIIQGGGFLGTVNTTNNGLTPTAVATASPIPNEPGISNKRGTIAMAQNGSDANSATSQWFINVADNGGSPNNLDTRFNNGGP